MRGLFESKLWLVATLSLLVAPLVAASTTMTYQGQLQDGGGPVSSNVDMSFVLYDAATGGNPVGDAVVVPGVTVSDGLFHVELDFGDVFDGSPLWLAVTVAGSELSPRQRLGAAPVAAFALAGNEGPPGPEGPEGPQGPEGDSHWSTETWTSGIFFSGGNVGLGTSSPEAQLHVAGSAIFGNSVNRADGADSFVTGGFFEDGMFLRNSVEAARSAIVGGKENLITLGGDNSFIGGGRGNVTDGERSFIGGGRGHTITGADAFIAGGVLNRADGANSFAAGTRARTNHDNTFVWSDNSDEMFFTTTGEAQFLIRAVGGVGIGTNSPQAELDVAGSLIVGLENAAQLNGFAAGLNNTASGGRSFVGGGMNNEALGPNSFVAGGSSNSAGGSRSFAAGTRAKAQHTATFVWADDANEDFSSTGQNQFMVRSTGGVGFGRAPSDHFEIQTPFSPTSGDGSGEDGALRVRLDGSTRFRVMRNGGVAIGSSYSSTGVPERGLRVAGEVRVGSFASSTSTQVCRTGNGTLAECNSSERYKRDIQPLEMDTRALAELRPVRFRWIENDEPDLGLIAEEVAELFPELVFHGADGQVEGIVHGRLLALLIAAHKDFRRETDTALAELAAENRRLRQLAADNAALQERLARVEALLIGEHAVAERAP